MQLGSSRVLVHVRPRFGIGGGLGGVVVGINQVVRSFRTDSRGWRGRPIISISNVAGKRARRPGRNTTTHSALPDSDCSAPATCTAARAALQRKLAEEGLTVRRPVATAGKTNPKTFARTLGAGAAAWKPRAANQTKRTDKRAEDGKREGEEIPASQAKREHRLTR